MHDMQSIDLFTHLKAAIVIVAIGLVGLIARWIGKRNSTDGSDRSDDDDDVV